MRQLNRYHRRLVEKKRKDYMSRFLEPLKVETFDGLTWTVLEDMDYEVGKFGSGDRIVVRAGTTTDFGSVPRFLWSLISPIGRATRAFVLHDYLYATQPYPRAKCDKILLEALGVLGLPKTYSRVIYLAVRAAGWVPWLQRKKALKKKDK